MLEKLHLVLIVIIILLILWSIFRVAYNIIKYNRRLKDYNTGKMKNTEMLAFKVMSDTIEEDLGKMVVKSFCFCLLLGIVLWVIW